MYDIVSDLRNRSTRNSFRRAVDRTIDGGGGGGGESEIVQSHISERIYIYFVAPLLTTGNRGRKNVRFFV